MDPRAQVVEARDLGRAMTLEGVELVRGQVRSQLRRSMGMRRVPPPPCDDPAEAYFPPDSVTRQVHGDLPAMLIGGLSTLLFQMLHPLAMAAVTQHSHYQTDPLGRLERTADFLGTTTFGSRAEAHAALARVRGVHALVVGTAPDGRPYAAADPDLLTWVHTTEVRSFLAATRAYAPHVLSPAEEDAYVDEMSRVAVDLGAVVVPRTVDGLEAYFEAVRPELRLTVEARTARNFIVRGVGRWPHEITTHGLLVAAAQGVLPPWARRELRLPTLPGVDQLAVRPAARALGSALRWVVARPVGLRVPALDFGAAGS